MTMTKRQKFIYRFKQGINMLKKSIVYFDEVSLYMENSAYYKVSNKIIKKLSIQLNKSETLLAVVDKKYIDYLNKRDKVV